MTALTDNRSAVAWPSVDQIGSCLDEMCFMFIKIGYNKFAISQQVS